MAKQERCAVYHRVSTADQDPGLAIDELRQAAVARGMTIAMEVQEVGSGAKNNRPGLLRVLDAARRGQIDAVICWKLDRFARSSLDLLSNIQQLEDSGVRFIACTQSIDIKPNGDAISKLILSVLGGVAQFERSLLIERTRLGLTKARQAGKLLGRRVSRDAPDPTAVHALRASGASWSAIGKKLTCTSSAARRALTRLVGNGVSLQPAK